ncbi:MAG: hypothetical protein HYS41_04385 [Candidatus Omnitrophica bacterium]|nr:hypothetical protein [Candidatus Omnitrophota bacterium]
MSKTERGKTIAGVVYLAVGILVLFLRHESWMLNLAFLSPLKVNPWCIAWTSIGIGAGLINTRRTKPPSPWWVHYFFYYGFVLVVVSLASFVVSNLVGHEASDTKALDGLAALIGLAGGFVGHRLHEVVLGHPAKE